MVSILNVFHLPFSSPKDAMLSHPLLLKADANTGPRLLFSQPQMMAAAVVVLPVPGGPWIKLKRLGEKNRIGVSWEDPVEEKSHCCGYMGLYHIISYLNHIYIMAMNCKIGPKIWFRKALFVWSAICQMDDLH